MDEHLLPWVLELNQYLNKVTPPNNDSMMLSTKIIFESATEMYLSILQPGVTTTVKAILTRTLVECYADTYSIFRHRNPGKKSKKYINYAHKMNGMFARQASDYTAMRDAGVEGDVRLFEVAKTSTLLWDGKGILSRIEAIERDRHILAYYEFFCLFVHMNPIRKAYAEHLDSDPILAKYYSYIMLVIMQSLVANNNLPEKYFLSLNEIAAGYADYYSRNNFAPKLKESTQ